MTQEKDDAERVMSGFSEGANVRNMHMHSSRRSMELDIYKHFMFSYHNLKKKKH